MQCESCDHDGRGVVRRGGEAGGQTAKSHVDPLCVLADGVHLHEPQDLDALNGDPHATRWAVEPLARFQNLAFDILFGQHDGEAETSHTRSNDDHFFAAHWSSSYGVLPRGIFFMMEVSRLS